MADGSSVAGGSVPQQDSMGSIGTVREIDLRWRARAARSAVVQVDQPAVDFDFIVERGKGHIRSEVLR